MTAPFLFSKSWLLSFFKAEPRALFVRKKMITDSAKIVQLSFGRCLSNGDLIQAFYDNFLKSNLAIKPMFIKTDFDKQKALLKHGLNLMIMYAKGDLAGELGLERIKQSHSKINLNIKPELYIFWKNSLISTVEVFDRKFDNKVKESWSQVIDHGVKYIASGYSA